MINSDDGSVLCESGLLISRYHTPGNLISQDKHGKLVVSKNPHLSEISYITGATTAVGHIEFEATIECRNDEIKQIFLKTRHGPASLASWDEVTEDKLKEEFDLVKSAATAELQKSPNRKRSLFCSWHFPWGEIQVVAEEKSFQCGLFLKYR